MDLELNSEEAKIEERLYKAFGCYPAQFIKPFTFHLAIRLSQGMPLSLGALFLGYLYSKLDQLHYNELAGSPYHIVDFRVSIVMLQAFA